jgi:hypothetical protein
MSPDERSKAMQTEIQFLRVEIELNRKYIFERPFIILAGAFAAAATLHSLVGYDALPMLFTILMGFNLWFTYNRLQSSSRIISYLQVVHTPGGESRWIGWEAALNNFRHSDVVPPALAFRLARRQSNRFYGPILYFHLLVVALISGFILAQTYPTGIDFGRLSFGRRAALLLDAVSLTGFLVLTWYVRPSTVTHSIEQTREVWEHVLPNTSEYDG